MNSVEGVIDRLLDGVDKKEGIGNAARGCRKPKPPLEIGRVAIVKECAGKDSMEKVPVMKVLIIVENLSARGLFQLYQSSGRRDSSVLTTSEAKRWVILWRVHVLKSRVLVCLSVRFCCIHTASASASCSLDMWKLLQNSFEPMGTPKMRRPSVTSTGVPLFREYWLMACGREDAAGWASS